MLDPAKQFLELPRRDQHPLGIVGDRIAVKTTTVLTVLLTTFVVLPTMAHDEIAMGGVGVSPTNWLAFLRSEYSRIQKARPESLDSMDSYPAEEDFYEAGPVFEGVKYLVFLGRRDDEGRYPFPVSTHPSATNRGFWGDAAGAWEARLRGVLASDELMDEARRRRPAATPTN